MTARGRPRGDYTKQDVRARALYGAGAIWGPPGDVWQARAPPRGARFALGYCSDFVVSLGLKQEAQTFRDEDGDDTRATPAAATAGGVCRRGN